MRHLLLILVLVVGCEKSENFKPNNEEKPVTIQAKKKLDKDTLIKGKKFDPDYFNVNTGASYEFKKLMDLNMTLIRGDAEFTFIERVKKWSGFPDYDTSHFDTTTTNNVRNYLENKLISPIIFKDNEFAYYTDYFFKLKFFDMKRADTFATKNFGFGIKRVQKPIDTFRFKRKSDSVFMLDIPLQYFNRLVKRAGPDEHKMHK